MKTLESVAESILNWLQNLWQGSPQPELVLQPVPVKVNAGIPY